MQSVAGRRPKAAIYRMQRRWPSEKQARGRMGYGLAEQGRERFPLVTATEAEKKQEWASLPL